MSHATLSEPRGLARAAAADTADETFRQETKERQALESAQARNAVQLKLERLARKDPNIRDLLSEYTALRETVAAAQERAAAAAAQASERIATLESELALARDSYSAAASKIEELSASVQTLERERAKLAEDLEAARSDAGKARAQLARLKDTKG